MRGGPRAHTPCVHRACDVTHRACTVCNRYQLTPGLTTREYPELIHLVNDGEARGCSDCLGVLVREST